MKCQAYIDPETKIALEGEALVAASKNPDAPRCGYELEPGDMFCPSCGACVEISSGGVAEASNATHNKKRTTRAAFWGAVVLFFLTNLLYFALVGENYNAMDGSLGRGIFIKILGYVNLFAYGFYIKTSIRRLHDIERSGWWIAPSICFTIIATVLTIISAITESSNVVFSILDWVAIIGNLGMVVWLGFAKGTKGPNKYGPDPLANDVVFGNREADATPKGEVPIGTSSPALNDPKLDGDVQSWPSSAASVEPPKPRAKYRTLSIVLFIVFGIASFVLQYVNRQQRTQMNAYNSEIDRHIRTALSASKAYGSLNDPSALKLLGATKKAKLDGMFGDAKSEYDEDEAAKAVDDAEGILDGGSILRVSDEQKEALRQVRFFAEKGHVPAQYLLATLILAHKVHDNEDTPAKAVELLERAAEQGHADAQYDLGNMYYIGSGVKEDNAEAVKWFRKAAEQGHADAQYDLGVCLLHGKGTAKDPKEAADWFEKAAEQDNLDACYEIGRAYERGNGRTKNMNKATEWYKKGAATGNYGCCVQLGFRYLRGDCSTIKKDVDKALELFLQSIKGNQNGIWAYHGAGLAYLERAKGPSDYQKAVEMFRKAAGLGLDVAQYCLGNCYRDGRGVKQDQAEAVKWYRKAAEQGHKNAKQALKRLGVDSE